jgi:hypothetical protein
MPGIYFHVHLELSLFGGTLKLLNGRWLQLRDVRFKLTFRRKERRRWVLAYFSLPSRPALDHSAHSLLTTSDYTAKLFSLEWAMGIGV